MQSWDNNDEDEGFFNSYSDGHWVWSQKEGALVFVSYPPSEDIMESFQLLKKVSTSMIQFRDVVDLIEQDKFKHSTMASLVTTSVPYCYPPSEDIMESFQLLKKVSTSMIQFRDVVDLIEQMRYRRRYQRKLKPGQKDIVTLQDVKDIAIYTAPVHILTPRLINMLHLPTTERFIRALILFCQYYLQVTICMSDRILELKTKIRTPQSDLVEGEYQDNLADLRLLVAKEYCLMLIGGGDMKKFHHMGPGKKRRSLLDKDAQFFETLLCMCVQIIWLALGRYSYNQIELEVNRLFKTETFNAVEHTLKTGYVAKMKKEERDVLFGQFTRHQKMLCTRSPLMNEVIYREEIDYSMMGLGVIKAPRLTPRLQYMLLAVAGSEEILKDCEIVLGIIGMPRSCFDTMLKPLPIFDKGKSKGSMLSSSSSRKKSKSTTKSSQDIKKPYPDIVMPKRDAKKFFLPPTFPGEPERIRPCNETQRRRWQDRFQKLTQYKRLG